MAKGKKFNDDIKEKALAMLATNNNTREVAKTLGIKESTLRTWRSNPNNDEFAKLRQKKKKEFVEDAWRNIELAQEILSRRLERAVAHEVTLDLMLEETLKETTGADAKKAIRNKFSTITLEDVGKISTILGTLYDKQALAVDEPTVNVGGKLEDLIKKVEDKSEY
jgi:transposase